MLVLDNYKQITTHLHMHKFIFPTKLILYFMYIFFFTQQYIIYKRIRHFFFEYFTSFLGYFFRFMRLFKS